MSGYFLINTLHADDMTLINGCISQLEKRVADGYQIEQVLFYGQGAIQALLRSKAAKCWQAFSQKHSVPLRVCANSAVSRGVLDEILAKEEGAALSMNGDFQVTSLAIAFDQMAKARHVCSVDQLRDVTATDNTVAVIFNTLDSDSLDFKDGLDFLLLAASLDWKVTVIFQEEKCFNVSLKDLFALYEVSDVRFSDNGFNEKEFKLVITF
jgi:sulfur relay (sulfurtransferase) complex TusBCD TusD component (DsrE family)